MDKEKVANQLLVEIIELPNAKYLIPMLQQLDIEDLKENHKTVGWIAEWLLTGKYDHKLDDYIDSLPNVNKVIKSIFEWGNVNTAILDSNIFQMFNGLDRERMLNFLNALADVGYHLIGEIGMIRIPYFIEFVLTGINNYPHMMSDQYVKFIIDPDGLFRETLYSLSEYNYDTALELVEEIVSTYYLDDDLDKLKKLPYEERLAYGLDLINIPVIENNVKTIYNYFYPTFNVSNI